YRNQIDDGESAEDVVAYKQILNKYNSAKDSLNQLISLIRKNYPQYYQRLYESKVIELLKVREQMNEQQYVISYFIGDSVSYSLILGKDDYYFINLGDSKLIKSKVEHFLQ